jgi:hypothetical protein
MGRADFSLSSGCGNMAVTPRPYQPPVHVIVMEHRMDKKDNAKLDFVGKFINGEDITARDVNKFEPKELAKLLTIVSKNMRKISDEKSVAENNLKSTLNYFDELDKRTVSTLGAAHREVVWFIKEMRK